MKRPQASPVVLQPGSTTLREAEARLVMGTLAAVGGNKSAAARALGVSRRNLYDRIARALRDHAAEGSARRGG